MIISKQLGLNINSLSYIAKSYSPLDYMPRLLEYLADLDCLENLLPTEKLEAHRLINTLIIDHYPGEHVLKYHLFKLVESEDLVAAFEVKVNRSRLDFLTINGHTTSFEIKSDLDNLDKLEKQSKDYIKAFEYNNIVVHERHLSKVEERLPAHFGIFSFEKGEKINYRLAELNTNIDPLQQLRLLTKLELKKFFGSVEEESILMTYTAGIINEVFKSALKVRYGERWRFLKEHSSMIMPADIQFFFNTRMHPDLIYS